MSQFQLTAVQTREDVQKFLESLEAYTDPQKLTDLTGKEEPLVRKDLPLVIARAPGRLDVMGGIADYSGSLVLELPLSEATFVAAQPYEAPVLMVVSLPGTDRPLRTAELPLDLIERGTLADYETAGQYFCQSDDARWAAYAAGVYLALVYEGKLRPSGGVKLIIGSDVPEGKGVSSSAALEVASMMVVAALHGVELEGRELAILCQRVENRLARAPCGVMDQMTVALGGENQLLALRCQPAELLPTVPIPDGLRFWGIDSGVRHSVSGADYTSVRIGAFMGYRIIAELKGWTVRPGTRPGLVEVVDPLWHGYLANIRPAEFTAEFARALPERMKGGEFLQQCGGTTDPVTEVQPDRDYPVFYPTAHPIYENDRVERFAELLKDPNLPESLEKLCELGNLMYESHDSYSRCGLGTPQTDLLVDLVRQRGPERGLFGAKITGGGSGGCVAVLGKVGAEVAIAEICEIYAQTTGYRPYVFAGSSPGAVRFGVIRIEQEAA